MKISALGGGAQPLARRRSDMTADTVNIYGTDTADYTTVEVTGGRILTSES